MTAVLRLSWFFFYAEKENVDLIVVGTRGRSGFKRLLLGSIASGVVTYAHCPVLVVKRIAYLSKLGR